MMQLNNGAFSRMSNRKNNSSKAEQQRVALTARLSLDAYNAITELQRQHRVKKGRALPIWKVIDIAVKDYAKKQGIKVGE